VVAIAVAFALQLVYIAIAEEPYPAIMMPRFSSAGPTGQVAIEIPVPEITLVYADGTSKTVGQSELLGDIPGGHQPTVMGSILTPLSKDPVLRGPDGRYQPPTWLFPGYHLARVSRDRPEHIASLKGWLRQRARAVYAGAPATRCVVNWFLDSYPYDPNSNPVEAERGHVLNGQFEVDLNADATTRN
jgi:hypothetical protein